MQKRELCHPDYDEPLSSPLPPNSNWIFTWQYATEELKSPLSPRLMAKALLKVMDGSVTELTGQSLHVLLQKFMSGNDFLIMPQF